ncbi:MAG: peptidylprolyl isomerase [Candidatus Magasanikbacteria bacterium]|nr:peptidylprolyl isomerase [Candidatus Magasanikbacteria bacterium]
MDNHVVKSNLKIFLTGFLGFIAVAAVLAVGYLAFSAYRAAPTTGAAASVASFLNLPALSVNGQSVSYRDYISDMKAIRMFQAFSQSSGSPLPSYTDEQLSDQVISRLAGNVVIEQTAARLVASVAPEEVAALKAQLLEEYKTVDAVNAELIKRYGWDLKTYERKVMNSYLLQQSVAEKISTDPAARSSLLSQAESVLKQIKDGADFALLAKQYGTDATKDQGGDLGWFKTGDMVPQFETAAFALKLNQVTDQPVESSYGFHLIKLTGRKTTTSKGADGKLVAAEEIRASHILFPFPTLEKYLANALKDAKIKLYIKVHNPFLSVATSTPV